WQNGALGVPFINNGGSMVGEIKYNGFEKRITLDYINNMLLNADIMGYEYDLDVIEKTEDNFIMPTYFELGDDDRLRSISEDQIPTSTNLVNTEVPFSQRPEITYLTPLDPECQWQDPNGPWRSPGPAAGPFTADLGDGSTLTYYWYRFVDQPAIIHANLPEAIRETMQARVELMHQNWKHTDEYFEDPEIGNIATIDPAAIVQPPPGMEIGYVPIVSRQEKSEKKLRVFVLAGQSNMLGFGTIEDEENNVGTLVNVLQNDTEQKWASLGENGNWNQLEDAHLYFANNGDTIRNNINVGQGANAT
ncbi:MAG: hypothetical protein AAGK97_18850, partial [Bacteroidota bacterium]